MMVSARKANILDDHGVEIYEGDLVYMFIDGLGESYIITDDNKCYLLMNPRCNYSRNKKCRGIKNENV